MIQKDNQIKLGLPKNYAASQYIKRLPYNENEDTNFQNKIIDLVKNHADLQKYLLATSTKSNNRWIIKPSRSQ